MSNTDLISTNPARGYEEIGRVTISNDQDVATAVKAARSAFLKWRALGVAGRKPYFEKFIELLKGRADEVAKLQTKEMGKPLNDSRGEVQGAIGWLEWQLEHAPDFLAVEVMDQYDDYQTELHFEPFGVVAAIAPWNYPTHQMMLATMQQLIAGNTVVFKHSEECSLT